MFAGVTKHYRVLRRSGVLFTWGQVTIRKGERPMKKETNILTKGSTRRSFLKSGTVAGAATMGAGLLAGNTFAFDREDEGGRASITKGDIAILRFLQALEAVEEDLWRQYAELGGTQDNEFSGLTGGNAAYTQALQLLDGDMPQYIHDNTDDEISHASFLKNYLESKGAGSADLTHFKVLPSSTADGAQQIGRLTNLTQLTIDTSFWSRYRSITNPDFDPNAPFAQAVPSLNINQHTAIPRSNADTQGSVINLGDPTQSTFTDHLKAIAFTAGFHFAFIEQGGTSLYPTLAQHVTNLEVLRILLSIGPTETMHFQTWHDKAGNAVSAPLAPLTDPKNDELKFPNLNVKPFDTQTFQTNLIMPEPTFFLSRKFPVVSIIRPTEQAGSGGAVATVQAFTADGLFIGQSKEFFAVLRDLAEQADAARRGF